MSNKINEIITSKIIEELEKGLIPWSKPWSGQGQCVNYITRKPYSFLNEMLLGRTGEYLTFNQVKQLKGSVKKGAKASMVTFYKMQIVEEENSKGEKVQKKIPLLRYYNVFHISDTDGIESKALPAKPFNTIENAESTINNYFTKHNIKFENVAGDKAYYSPSSDKVVLPLKKQFANEPKYYSVLFHESVHSTGHESRLNRLTKIASFGNEEYSKEELTAEIGASIMMNNFSIDTEATFTNSCAYIQGWLKVLKNDNNMIVSASSKAQKAVELILDKQPQIDEE